MADEPIEALGGRTPLEAASTPVMDKLAPGSEIGMVRTVPEGMTPGSDTANLSVLGYDAKKCYTGRSPLEALSIGVPMKDTDIAIRCNLVSVTEDGGAYEDQVIFDHSSSEISTEDAAILLDAVRAELENEEFKFYLGTSYRHCLIWDKGQVAELMGPHNIPGQVIGGYLPEEPKLKDLMKRSYDILKDHPLNKERKAAGLNPANSIWFWGAGTKPSLESYKDLTGLKGAMISAVDLLKGIAVGAGMTNIEVEGANGGLHTNYRGKAEAAVKAVLDDGFDYVYVHVEAPDEMGHAGSMEKKIQAIENIDRDVVGVIKDAMDRSGEHYRIMILPDHPTPIAIRTHTSNPVPYLIYDSNNTISGSNSYDEVHGKASGRSFPCGPALMEHFIQEEIC